MLTSILFRPPSLCFGGRINPETILTPFVSISRCFIALRERKEWLGKINRLWLILQATDSKAVRSVVDGHDGIATDEVQVA